MIINILLFVFCLCLIVSLHEFGHLLAAKAFHVYCQEYSIGMGPKLLSFKGKETEYNLRAFPVGGFVAMAGDNDNALETSVEVKDIPFERTLLGIAKWKRIVVMLAGIAMNFVLAIIIIGLVLLHIGSYGLSGDTKIVGIQEDMPAYDAGLQVNDIVESIEFSDGTVIVPKSYTELSSLIDVYGNEDPWIVTVNRNNEEIKVTVTPVYIEDNLMIGIEFSSYEYVDINLFNCFYYAFDFIAMFTKITFFSIVNLFRGVGLNNLSGPVGIYETVSEASSLGIDYYFEVIAMLSVNVGLMNALPFPIFDGGRVVLLLIEVITRKPLNKKLEETIMSVCVILLLLLFVFVTFKDIVKLF